MFPKSQQKHWIRSKTANHKVCFPELWCRKCFNYFFYFTEILIQKSVKILKTNLPKTF